MNAKKVMMDHDLAEALMRSGMDHYDMGGTVAGQVTPGSTANNAVNSIGNFANTTQNGFANFTQAGLAPVGGLFQGLGQAFTNQNGYQAQLAPTDYTNFGSVINPAVNQSLNGYGQAQSIQGQQQALSNALLAQSQGAGPNPAQAALAQSTGQNVANQAALMAGQRGARSNVGLIARQAAQQGAATQQQAAGQAATLQAQQQIAAQNALQQQQSNMANQNIAEQGVNNQLYGTSAGAQNTQNSNNIQNYNMAQGINSQVAQNNSNAVNKTEGGLFGGASSLLSMLAKGGEVKAPNKKVAKVPDKDRMNEKFYPSHLKEMASIYHPSMMADGGQVGQSASVNVPNLMAPVSSDSSGGDSKSSGGGIAGLAALLKSGGKVPGKAQVKGDSFKNDNVPALLSPGEVVIPRSIMDSDDPASRAAKFVADLVSKGGKKPESDFREALKKAVAGRKKT